MDIELRPADDGCSGTVTVGGHATVRLPETATTGYRWMAEYDDAVLRLVDDRTESAVSSRGAAGDRVLVFEALSAGVVRLRLAKRRAWESGPPVEQVAIELEVQVPRS